MKDRFMVNRRRVRELPFMRIYLATKSGKEREISVSESFCWDYYGEVDMVKYLSKYGYTNIRRKV